MSVANYEEKYWELRKAVDRAYDKCCSYYTADNHIAYLSAKQIFENFCVGVLEKLIEENSDVLARLK